MEPITLENSRQSDATRGFGAVARQLWKHKGAMCGLSILLLLTLIALCAPWLAPYDPLKVQARKALQPPSAEFLLGTDQYGRDVLSRTLYGTRISLLVGSISVGIAAVCGLMIGLVAGYFGGVIDSLLMRLMDVMLAFPGILLALAIVSILGPNLANLMIAVGISAIPAYARLVRGSVLAAKQQLYVEAARVVGCGHGQILFRHILPNVAAPVIVLGTLGMGTAILAAAALSFLGLGSQPPTPEWGRMLSEGRAYLREHWWIATTPGVAILITVLAMNLLGDGLRDALDPRLKI
ncbi:MAG: nickel transporter permease [Candidatus Entotheonellia bacterium]